MTEAAAPTKEPGFNPKPHVPQRGRPRHRPYPPERVLDLHWTPTIRQFIRDVKNGVGGPQAEYLVLGTRGDGKTQGIFGAMLAHAAEHQKRGFALPTIWMGVADTFQSHKIKTVASLEQPWWKGTWRMSESDHLATAVVNGVEVVKLLLFGIEDQGAMDRVRMEVNGVWFEEPAPAAVLVQSSGVELTSWLIALTSRRNGYTVNPDNTDRPGSHCYPAIITENYPDEDHWTWKRFAPQAAITGQHPSDPALRWYRVPPGERASATQRAEWNRALADRPDLLRRLLAGEPGTVQLGTQVAQGFREDLHVSKERLHPIPGEPLVLAVDFGHTPCVIVGQAWHGQRRVVAALCEHGGIKQHLETNVLPWLHTHAPWAMAKREQMIRGCYDPAGMVGEQSDIERTPLDEVERLVGGLWFPGPVDWESRKHILLSAINHHIAPGTPSLQVDPVDALPLVRALSGRWYYPQDRVGQVRRDFPKKPNHPWEDLGDTFIYWLWALTSDAGPPTGNIKVESRFNIADQWRDSSTVPVLTGFQI